MRARVVSAAIIGLVTLLAGTLKAQQGDKSISPEPKIESLQQGTLNEVSVEPGFGAPFRAGHTALFSWLDTSLQPYHGDMVSLDIKLKDDADLPGSIETRLNRKEAYYLEFGKKSITLVGNDTLGVLDGLVTLKKYLVINEGKLPQGYIIDWPDINIRAFHFVASGVSQQQALELMKRARDRQFNTLVVQLADGVQIEGTKVPARPDAWSQDFLQKISTDAREMGMRFIPEIKLLSHQEKFFKRALPGLMFNSKTLYPSDPQTRNVITTYLDKIIGLVHPEVIHIGHDEVLGVYTFKSKSVKGLKSGEKALPARLFKQSILFLHDYLQSRGITVWMWGDMLLNRGDFPGMVKWTQHGNAAYAQILDDLPRDIVICDWHYWTSQKDFPTASYFAENGFKVIGVSWKKAENIQKFSRYVAGMKENGSGMMATSWSYVKANKQDTLNRILNISANRYWNAR